MPALFSMVAALAGLGIAGGEELSGTSPEIILQLFRLAALMPLLISLFGTLIWLLITAYLVFRRGQTVGKALLRIKVVRSDGSRASFARIFWMRNVLNTLPTLIPLIGLFYWLIDSLFIYSDRHRCLHDRIADTIVVRV